MSRASSSRKRNARRPRVKGIHRVSRERASGEIVRHHYAWRGGPKFWTSEDGPSEGSPEYWALYDRAVARLDYSRGKFRELLRAFLGSREFEQLKPRTQKDYQRLIFGLPDGQSIDDEFGDAPLQASNDPRIQRAAYEWRDRFSSPRVADPTQDGPAPHRGLGRRQELAAREPCRGHVEPLQGGPVGHRLDPGGD